MDIICYFELSRCNDDEWLYLHLLQKQGKLFDIQILKSFVSPVIRLNRVNSLKY